MSLPLVAIVGKPNIGKSTLFNRLVGSRRAIVTDEPGVTRDRIYGEVHDVVHPFRVVDTGGLTPRTAAPFAREIETQAEAALAEAECVLFVVDARDGLTAVDREVAAFLRRRSVPIVVVANKVDSEAQEPLLLELHELGLGTPIGLSAEHGRGMPDLIDAIEEILGRRVPQEGSPDAAVERDRPVRVAIVGRPNAGKSSLLNRLLGEERALVSDIPGTTRDAVDTVLELGEHRFVLVDTAGIRRRGKVELSAEASAVLMARRSIERADVVVLVIDAARGFAAQDAHIAGYAIDAFRPVIVAVNKWDLVEDREAAAKAWSDELRRRLRFARETPVVLVSAKSGQRVAKILDQVTAAHAAACIRVPTPELNRWLGEESRREQGAPVRGSSIRLYYATQTGVNPPSFVLFCNRPAQVHFSLRRRFANSLRRRFGFGPAPIRLEFRSRRGGD